MTTVNRTSCLCGWLVRCAGVALSLAFCASVMADPDKTVVTPAKQETTQKVIICYVKTIASGIPQPCRRYVVGIPTTASPVVVMGRVR